MPIKPTCVSQDALTIIVDSIRSVSHGTVALIVQDGRLLQIERTDKIRLDSFRKSNPGVNRSADIGRIAHENILDDRQIARLRCRVAEQLKDLAFGQIILIIKDNLLVQIERIEKQRLAGLEGIYGDGI
ncbi:hypothetical protein AXX12_15270 [Anaerosporomusa subterranea]|uniref:DUF2292 domain-containing protein n=1 Tax=Anaerosporomusa subterranea TaxID=1794912 RepID=A0A154BN40_ANASB|nr:YezD family protein [Anaerosporomusa subterranea]KYZ74938.1 hypothetical protein AXX12_15270 [Anaerosporomusa subterranea]